MDKDEIYEKISDARRKRYINNLYSMDVIERINGVWSIGDEFTFSYSDHGINRIVFFASDWRSVNKLIKKVNIDRPYLEFLAKDPKQFVPQNGIRVASMKRMANMNCKSVFEVDSPVLKYINASNSYYAEMTDTEEINNIFWNTFNTEISHLLSNEELAQKIMERRVSIHRNESNKIDAVLQVDVMPKKFYINQIVNLTSRDVIHSMLLTQLKIYVSNGGRYLYAWVEDNNIASLKFHEKYGMKHDGMWSLIYCLMNNG